MTQIRRPQTRRPKIADLVRWYAEAGLQPRVTIAPDGTIVVDAHAANETDAPGLSKTSVAPKVASRIDRLGTESGKGAA